MKDSHEVIWIQHEKAAPKFHITDTDRAAIENSSKFLMAAFGYPDRSQAQLTFSQEHFQHCFAPEGFTIQNIVNDLAIILQLEPSKITFDFHEDIRDTFGIPYELKDQETDIQSQQIGDTFKIHIAKNIQKSHQTKS